MSSRTSDSRSDPHPDPNDRRLLHRLLSPAHADMAKVVGGTLSRNILRGSLKLLIAGLLTPQYMGILRSVFAFFKIMANVADMGLDSAMVTFVARAIREKNVEEQHRVLKAVLCLKAMIALAFVVAGNLFAEPLARGVLSDPSLTIYVRLVFFAVGGQLLWKYASNTFAAHQQFGRVGFFLTTMPAVMLLTVAGLLLTGKFSLPAAIAVYLFAPAVTALLWLPAMDRTFLRLASWNSQLVGRIFRFSRWVYLSNVTSSIRSHVNTLLLKNPRLSGTLAAGEVNAGLYSFGNDLANEITVFSESLLTVLLPKASSKITGPELRRFLRKSYKGLAAAIVPLALLMLLAKPMILVLGAIKESYTAYLPSIPVFMILYSGALFTVAAIPMKTALYSMKLPRIETWTEILTAIVLVVGCVLLIPRYGCVGAAWAVFAVKVLSFVVIMSYGIVKVRRHVE